MKIIDISQEICPEMMVYPGDPSFHSRAVSSFKQGGMCEVSEMTIGSHCGTHIDAPLHMIPGGASIETADLSRFIGPCRVLTIDAHVITDKMLLEHNVQPGERILLRTDPRGAFYREKRFNPSVLSAGAAQYLSRLPVALVGIDSPTIENMEISDGEIHRMLLGAGVAVLEGLHLEQAKGEHYVFSALPLLLKGENGSPCRAVLIEKE